MEKTELTPKCVFSQFAKINAIPRPSKHEERMIAYLKEFGKSHGLETKVDETGNVLICKPATPGYEDRAKVVLQSHMDMVCERLVDVEIDFLNDPIQTYVDGEWLKAKGTTLGADDGIGVAIELALLESDDIAHGPIECLFTVDEETGLTGAFGLQSGFMTGDMLINLDSEDEGQIFVSCAGGINTAARFHFTREEALADLFFIKASLKGLNGGHSGDDINKKRANAIKILARFLYTVQEKWGLRLAEFHSGKVHNAIPRDGWVLFGVPFDKKEDVRAEWNIFTSQVEEEFHVTEHDMVFGGSVHSLPYRETGLYLAPAQFLRTGKRVPDRSLLHSLPALHRSGKTVRGRFRLRFLLTLHRAGRTVSGGSRSRSLPIPLRNRTPVSGGSRSRSLPAPLRNRRPVSGCPDLLPVPPRNRKLFSVHLRFQPSPGCPRFPPTSPGFPPPACA